MAPCMSGKQHSEGRRGFGHGRLPVATGSPQALWIRNRKSPLHSGHRDFLPCRWPLRHRGDQPAGDDASFTTLCRRGPSCSSRQQPHREANHMRAKCLDGPLDRSVRTRNCKSGWRARGTAKNNRCRNCVLQSLTIIRKGDWAVQLQVRISVAGHNRIHGSEI